VTRTARTVSIWSMRTGRALTVRPPRSEASVRIVSTRIGGDSLLEWCPIVPTATV